MDDSDSGDELIICTFHLMTTIVNQKHKLNERGQKRKIWERDWIAKRREHSAYHGLVREMRESDPAAYRNFWRMDDEFFRTLLQSVAASIQRQDTTLRKATP